MEIKLNITGVKELAAKLDPAPRERALIRGLNKSGQLIKGWIQRQRLSGPRPEFLGVVSNRLRSSIATSGTKREGDSLINTIGTNVEYASVHEFGFFGRVNVKSSMRQSYKKFKYKAGRERVAVDAKGNRMIIRDFVTRTKKIRGQDRFVIGHDKMMDIPARPFMRPSIEDPENQQEILSILTEELQKALDA